MKSKLTGTVLAISAAAAFTLTPVVANANHSTSGKMIHCAGVNACKGHSSCKTASSSCKGKNACKGQGYVSLTKAQCDQVGGTKA